MTFGLMSIDWANYIRSIIYRKLTFSKICCCIFCKESSYASLLDKKGRKPHNEARTTRHYWEPFSFTTKSSQWGTSKRRIIIHLYPFSWTPVVILNVHVNHPESYFSAICNSNNPCDVSIFGILAWIVWTWYISTWVLNVDDFHYSGIYRINKREVTSMSMSCNEWF